MTLNLIIKSDALISNELIRNKKSNNNKNSSQTYSQNSKHDHRMSFVRGGFKLLARRSLSRFPYAGRKTRLPTTTFASTQYPLPGYSTTKCRSAGALFGLLLFSVFYSALGALHLHAVCSEFYHS